MLRCVAKDLKLWYSLVILSLVLSFGLVTSAAAASDHQDKKAHDRPAWLNKLETQIDYEDMMSGMEGRQDRLDQTFMKLMGRLQDKIKEHASPASTGGGFHDSWSAHQLQQSYLLGPTEAADKVFRGAHCPSNAPVKKYNVNAVNVEITLNQWGDYYPGYTYVLKEDIPKLVMHDGSDGSYPIAKHMTGTSTYVHHPYTNKPVNVFGKPSGKLIGSGSKKYYIPHLTRYPTAEKIEDKPGYYLNPYDKREVRMARSKPGALVSSPSAGTFFYLPK